MHRFVTALLMVAGCWLGLPIAILGQEADPGTIDAAGLSVVERQPEIMRLQVEVFGKGKDLKAALQALATRRDETQKQLAELGALEGSVNFGPPKLSAADNQQQRQMEMMIRRQMLAQRGGRSAPKPAGPTLVSVSLPLTAEWTLEADSIEQLLLVSHELQEQIKAADLAGVGAAEELSPEEAELAEEMEAATMSYGEEQPKPGEPSFLFVSKISDADHQKALGEAFERARAEAGRLAKAASVELGSLRQLTSGGEQGFNMEDYSSYAQRYAFFGTTGMPGSPSPGVGAREASGPQPGPVTYTVAVKASFNLKSP